VALPISLLALVATIIFILRRVVLKTPRFQHSELKGWPRRDALIILSLEFLLILAIFTMNSADMVLQGRAEPHYPDTGQFPISGWWGPSLWSDLSTGTLIILERSGWWLHILVVFGFLISLPISTHLHIMLVFPISYFPRLTPRVQTRNMP